MNGGLDKPSEFNSDMLKPAVEAHTIPSNPQWVKKVYLKPQSILKIEGPYKKGLPGKRSAGRAAKLAG